MKIAVLCGGDSPEREVSINSGRRVAQAAATLKHQARAYDVTLLRRPQRNAADMQAIHGLTPLIGMLETVKPDLAVLMFHGAPGEDGSIQAVLEMMGVRYTGSGISASVMSLNKVATKRMVAAEGIPVAEDLVLRELEHFDCRLEKALQFGLPSIIKPMCQGSTVGMNRVFEPEQMRAALTEAFRYDPVVLVERFVRGVELTVPVLGTTSPMAMPSVEIIPSSGYYDYAAKYTPGATEEIVPARLPQDVLDLCAQYAITVHQVMGCRGVSRSDFIYTGDQAVFLEVNTIPGMTATSLVPRSAQHLGWSFERLVERLIEDAMAGE